MSMAWQLRLLLISNSKLEASNLCLVQNIDRIYRHLLIVFPVTLFEITKIFQRILFSFSRIHFYLEFRMIYLKISYSFSNKSLPLCYQRMQIIYSTYIHLKFFQAILWGSFYSETMWPLYNYFKTFRERHEF